MNLIFITRLLYPGQLENKAAAKPGLLTVPIWRAPKDEYRMVDANFQEPSQLFLSYFNKDYIT